MAELKERWGAAIREQRQEVGMSQRELAEAVGVDQSAVSLWEKGAGAPTVDHQLAIAKALGVAPRVLFTYPEATSA